MDMTNVKNILEACKKVIENEKRGNTNYDDCEKLMFAIEYDGKIFENQVCERFRLVSA